MKSSKLLFSVFLLAFFGVTFPSFGQTNLPDAPVETPRKTLQLIKVVGTKLGESSATIYCLERQDSESPWKEVFPAIPAQIGRKGIAPVGEKKEKDGRTPQTEFGIGFLFGIDEEAPEGVTLPYRQTTPTDFWIDEATDPLYNHWISGEEPTVSHESLLLNDPRYDLVLTSLYNVDPTQPGKGSAIFFHLWKDPDYPTSGCVSTSRENVLQILRWLDVRKKPRIRVTIQSDDKH